MQIAYDHPHLILSVPMHPRSGSRLKRDQSQNPIYRIDYNNQLGYSYEEGFNQIANPFGKTHEISINYAWDTRR